MEYIKVTSLNLDNEHICCALSNKDDIQVSSKKAWMKECFDDGLVFIKSQARGKCFIEYIPAENAWVPIIANNYLYIDCLWVAGSFKGHGYSKDLLRMCIDDAKSQGKDGICILSSKKKKPFLADPKFLAYQGFKLADESDAGINLMYLPFNMDAIVPKFKACAKQPKIEAEGYVLYYTNQCPFNAKYVPIVEKCAQDNHIPFKAIKISTKSQAQQTPSPCTTYALFYDGEFISNEQLNEARFLKLHNEILNKKR